jgi:anti-anti-sigma factor
MAFESSASGACGETLPAIARGPMRATHPYSLRVIHMLLVSANKRDSLLVVTLEGRIDASSAKDFERQCLQWVDQGEKQLVCDFKSVNYISSAGLRVFLVLAKQLRAVQGSVRLCAMNAAIREVFEISGFSQLFAIADTVEDYL